jgi:hypothetical protein
MKLSFFSSSFILSIVAFVSFDYKPKKNLRKRTVSLVGVHPSRFSSSFQPEKCVFLSFFSVKGMMMKPSDNGDKNFFFSLYTK